MRKDALALRSKGTEAPPAPLTEDFGFHYPLDYVRRTVTYLRRGWGWPEAGGWAEQDQRLIDDVDTWLVIYDRVDRAVEAGWQGEDEYEPMPETVTFRMDAL